MRSNLHPGRLLKNIILPVLCSAVLLLCAHCAQAQVTVSPGSNSLTFGIPSGTPGTPPSSTPQNVTLTVTSGSITFPSPAWSISGPYAGQFSVTGDTCSGATVTASNSCQIPVTFSSSSSTLQTATLFLSTVEIPSGDEGTYLELPCISLSGAYGAIKLWDETTVQPSLSSASFTDLSIINSANLNLSCPASPVATLSGTPDGSGNVEVDNYITLAINGTPVSTYLGSLNDEPPNYSALYPTQIAAGVVNSPASPAGNICQGSDAYPDTYGNNTYPECFSAAYRSDVANLVGVYTDFIANANNIIPPVNDNAAGGVAPLGTAGEGNDLGTNFFAPNLPESGGTLQASFQALDAGGWFETSTLFLVTNCSLTGVAPGGAGQTIVGTPLEPGTTQPFYFNATLGSLDVFSAIIPNVETLTNVGATPFISTFSVPPSNASSLWANSPLATASCIASVSAGGNCAPKQEVCTTAANPTPSGANCVYDSTGAEDVLLSDNFSPVTPITSFPPGTNPGVVALNDAQGCPFAPPFSSSIACPSNGLKSFSGDPDPVHGGSNSYYYYVTGILPPSTTPGGFVNVGGTYWINGNNPQVTLTAAPPPAPIPNNVGWYPSPIDYIAYVNLPSTAAAPNPNYPFNSSLQSPPLPGAVVDFSENLSSGSPAVVTSGGISTTGSTCGSVLGNNGNILPASSTYSFEVNPVNLGTLLDTATYALYYETEDCTRTAERLYTYSASTPGWTTNYKSVAYIVDDDPPAITITVPSTGAIYPAKATVASSFTCLDLTPPGTPYEYGSGVAYCNGPSQINTTPGGSILTSESFTVTSSDNVGNKSSQTVNYSVSCLYAENTVSPATFTPKQNFYVTPSVTNCTKSSQSLTLSVALSGPLGPSCTVPVQPLTLVNGLTVPVPAGLKASVTLGPFSLPKNACLGNYTVTTTSSTKGVTDFIYSESVTVN